jgi:O-antigen/teichoic acid export membrane protein
MLSRLLLRNALILISINVVVKPLYTLLIEPAVQHRIGMSDYGRYAALLNITLIASVLLDLGITGWNTVQTAKVRGISSALHNKVLRIRFFLSFVYILAVMMVVNGMGYGPHDLMVALVLCATQICSSFILFLRSYTSGTLSFRDDRLLSVLDKVLLFVVMTIIIWGPSSELYPLTVTMFIGVQLLTALVVLIIALLIVRNYKHESSNATTYSQLLSSAFPFGLLFLFNIMMLRCDTIMIDFMNGPEEAGRYMMSYRFFEAIIMIAYLMSNILVPSFARYQNDLPVLRKVFNSGFRTAISFFILIAVVILLLRNEILEVVYGSLGRGQLTVFSLMTISSFFFSLQYVTGSFLTSMERLKLLISISLSGLILNVGLNYFLIPLHGALGAGYSSLLTQCVVLILQYYFVLRFLNDDTTRQTSIYSMALTVIIAIALYLEISLDLSGVQKALITFVTIMGIAVVLYKSSMLDLFFIKNSINNDK